MGGRLENKVGVPLSGKKYIFFLFLLCLQVCPQFETAKSLVLRACQKKQHGSHKAQNQDVSYDLLHAERACRRAVAYKFPPLIFENSEVRAVHSTDVLSHTGKNTQHSHRQCKGIGS